VSVLEASYLTYILSGHTRNIYLKVKKAGGMKITFQTPPKNLDEKIIYNVLRDYKILNCEVLVRDENGMSLTFTQPTT
jgi:ribosome-interacting GTPase 1